jgi:hypothetical protein
VSATSASRAALNNAHWCDLICRLHGAPGRFTPSAWVTSGVAPPLYPNLVTTADHPGETRADITRLLAETTGRVLAVKDSFGTLDLAPLGFALLFDAEWFWRPASAAPLRYALGEAHWSVLGTVAGLAAWESAWRIADGASDLPDRPMFPPPLLREADVQFLARCEREDITAGAISYRWQETNGISNVFGPAATAQSDFAACLALVAERNPSADIVGYGQPGFSTTFAESGLVAAGPLRVWVKPK